MHAELALGDAKRIGRKRVERLMRRAGLGGLVPRLHGRTRRSACRASRTFGDPRRPRLHRAGAAEYHHRPHSGLNYQTPAEWRRPGRIDQPD